MINGEVVEPRNWLKSRAQMLPRIEPESRQLQEQTPVVPFDSVPGHHSELNSFEIVCLQSRAESSRAGRYQEEHRGPRGWRKPDNPQRRHLAAAHHHRPSPSRHLRRVQSDSAVDSGRLARGRR